MNTAEKIYHNAQDLPEFAALEVLHFSELYKNEYKMMIVFGFNLRK